jgi:hypothetical protein
MTKRFILIILMSFCLATPAYAGAWDRVIRELFMELDYMINGSKGARNFGRPKDPIPEDEQVWKPFQQFPARALRMIPKECKDIRTVQTDNAFVYESSLDTGRVIGLYEVGEKVCVTVHGSRWARTTNGWVLLTVFDEQRGPENKKNKGVV